MPPAEIRSAHSTLAERYRVLLDIGHTLAGTLGYESLFRAIYRETAEVLEATGFYVALYDEMRDLATVVFYADRGEERRVEVTYPGSDSEVIRTGRGALVADRSSVEEVLILGEGEKAEVTRSSISAPIRRKGRVLGALSAQSYRADAYAEADLELLQGIADIAAVAIENARYVQELDRRRRESEQLEEIGRALTSSLDSEEVLAKVVDAVLSVTDTDGATVWLIEGTVARVATSRGEVALPAGLEWDLDGPLHERLVRRRETCVIDDLDGSGLVPEGVRDHLRSGSGLAVPLVVASEVVGVLSAGSRKARAFTSEEVKVVERIARQASVALENARLHASLQSLSVTDPLTGLPNRRHLQMHLQREVAAAGRGRHLVVVMFDLDNFKGYNDAHGHLAGDDALRSFGQILAEENRAMNVVARYGGDEFISVLTDSRREGAEGYVRRVQSRVLSDPILAPNGITVSWGMAEFDSERMSTTDDVIHAADADLYRQKGEKDS